MWDMAYDAKAMQLSVFNKSEMAIQALIWKRNPHHWLALTLLHKTCIFVYLLIYVAQSAIC